MARPITLRSNTARVGFGSLAIARILVGFIFLWAFLDKVFGLGFSTCRSAVTGAVKVGCNLDWLNGGSPTQGFLAHATKGPFAGTFQALAGHAWVDWLFMIGLLGIGVALLLGVAVRLAAVSGSVMLFLMWAAELWPANNPVLDEHIVYISLLIALAAFARYLPWGLGNWWRNLPVVQKMPWLV